MNESSQAEMYRKIADGHSLGRVHMDRIAALESQLRERDDRETLLRSRVAYLESVSRKQQEEIRRLREYMDSRVAAAGRSHLENYQKLKDEGVI